MLTRRQSLLGAVTIVWASCLPKIANASNFVLQTVTAWQNGVALPSSSGQIIDQAVADQIIATNKSLCAGLGYVVNADGSFTDPASGITVLQGYVEAAPFYDTPVEPFSGAPSPTPTSVTPDAFDAQTAKVFAWGQSECSNNGRGRYAAVTPKAWVYGGAGLYYPCADPIVGATGSDGSVWSRCADAAIGRAFNGSTVTRFVLGNCAVGGTSVNDWAPGGSQNAMLISRLSEFISHVGTPTHLVYSQGESDILSMTTSQWHDQWFAMLDSIRAIGCASKIWTGIETICDGHDAAFPNKQAAANRTPDGYIKSETGRQAIRAAQIKVGTFNINTLQGPNLDLIDWRLRAYGDGCHFGELGLAAAGQAWAAALFP